MLTGETLRLLYRPAVIWKDRLAISVQAGREPERHLRRQAGPWGRRVRERFVVSTHNFRQVGGARIHRIQGPPVIPARIGLDTGTVRTGRLTALLLPERERVRVPGVAANSRQLS